MTSTTVLTLASSSPRRRELLHLCGWMFNVAPVNIDETPCDGEDPGEYAIRMASEKARAADDVARTGTVILASDTTVADEGAILGKPADAVEAVKMLERLRGRVHQVHSAIAIIQHGKLTVDLATTNVPMRYYSDDELHRYIASGDPFDKAGGYAIQHRGFRPVENMRGCFANVMGLPLCHLVRTLANLNIFTDENVPQVCQNYLDYDCPVYQKVLLREI